MSHRVFPVREDIILVIRSKYFW